jgi:hypothetical protein
MRAINPIICALLRSPLHRLLSEQMLLLTYAGRRSGRRFTLPLGYARLEPVSRRVSSLVGATPHCTARNSHQSQQNPAANTFERSSIMKRTGRNTSPTHRA